MRKRLIAVLLTATLCTHAQKSKDTDIPPFGKLERSELEMKNCDFDPKAEAMVLFDAGELTCVISSSGVFMDLQHHVRIKILSDKGMGRADIKIPYHSYGGDETIKDLVAHTYNLDENGNTVVTKLDKKLIYEKKLNKRYSEKVFTFPDVKVGSIIEYKYTRTNVGLMNWIFQRSIPVKYSRFTIDFPEEIEVRVVPRTSRPYERKISDAARRISQLYAMRDIPALRDEPFIINEGDYLERIETKPIAINVEGRRTSLLYQWPGIIKNLMNDEDFGLQLKKDIPRTADLDESLKGITSKYQRMKIIHEYVRKNMEWNGYYGIWAFDGVKAAWKDRKGTVGEINLILVNLLKDAGLNAKPLLVSTHDNGMVNTADAGIFGNPGYNQFNKVMAWVEIENEVYVLDGTDKFTPSHLLPSEVLLTEALVIDKIDTYDWGWKTLWTRNPQSRQLVLINGSISGNGSMEGKAVINSYDYARLSRINDARKEKDKFLQKYFSSNNPGIEIASLEFENLDSDSLALVQNFDFKQQLNSSGDYYYFNTNLFTGLEKNPFIADNRLSDVFFGVNQSYSVYGNFQLPDNYELEAVPQNMRMIMPDTSISFSRVSQMVNGQLMVRIQLDIARPFFTATDYPDFHAFYKKLQEILDEQFVIRKKANPRP